MQIDDSELRALAQDMTALPARLWSWIPPVVERGALNIKNQLQAEMGASRHFGQIRRAINYDVRSTSMFGTGLIEAEIGPVAGSPGSLANIAYFGTSRGGGTVPDPQGALDAEAPKFEKALGDLLERWK